MNDINSFLYYCRSQHHESNTSLENILTMLMVNPEPLILMAFPASEGWPFPKYYGSCGRLAMVGWAGKMLTQFWQEPFTIRARLALQLLQIAQKESVTICCLLAQFFLMQITTTQL